MRRMAAGLARSDWHFAANHPGLLNLSRTDPLHMSKSAGAEIVSAQTRNAIGDTRISIDICDIYIGNVHRSVDITAAPPGVEGLIWREWHPSDIAESKSDPHAAAITEESYQRGRPIMPH